MRLFISALFAIFLASAAYALPEAEEGSWHINCTQTYPGGAVISTGPQALIMFDVRGGLQYKVSAMCEIVNLAAKGREIEIASVTPTGDKNYRHAVEGGGSCNDSFLGKFRLEPHYQSANRPDFIGDRLTIKVHMLHYAACSRKRMSPGTINGELVLREKWSDNTYTIPLSAVAIDSGS